MDALVHSKNNRSERKPQVAEHFSVLPPTFNVLLSQLRREPNYTFRKAFIRNTDAIKRRRKPTIKVTTTWSIILEVEQKETNNQTRLITEQITTLIIIAAQSVVIVTSRDVFTDIRLT